MTRLIFVAVLASSIAVARIANGEISNEPQVTQNSSRIQFAEEFVREIREAWAIQKKFEVELLEDHSVGEKLQTDIRNNTRLILEMQSNIRVLQSIKLDEPFYTFNAELRRLYQQKIGIHKEATYIATVALSGSKPGVDYGPMLARMPQATAEMENLNKGILNISAAIIFSLIDYETPGDIAHLIITKRKRKELIDSLNREFWSSLTAKNLNVLAGAALVLKGGLLKYKAADEPDVSDRAEQRPPSGSQRSILSGTGFAVTANGDLVTNEHVVSRCSYVTVARGSERFNGRVIERDPAADLAIVRLEQSQPPEQSQPVMGKYPERPSIDEVFTLLLGTKKTTFASLRQSPPLKAGEQAISFGFPLSGALATEGNLKVGNVSALRGLKDDPKEIQVTTPFQAGNSGGPVLDRSGNVIGVAVAKLNALAVLGAVGDLPQNVNFAINLQTLKVFLTKNKIPFIEAPSRDKLPPAEIGERARLFYLLD
jgi:S1-C subfamily serine protease